MKKWTSLILVFTLALTLFTACGNKETPAASAPGGVDGTMEEVIEKIYAQHEDIELSLISMELDLSDPDAVGYYTGLESAELLSDAAVSETMLGQPYSLVAVRVKNAADAPSVAQKMLDNIDTRKWICVAADTKIAAYSGDVAMFFMISSDFGEDATTDSVAEAFKAACGGTATILE